MVENLPRETAIIIEYNRILNQHFHLYKILPSFKVLTFFFKRVDIRIVIKQ